MPQWRVLLPLWVALGHNALYNMVLAEFGQMGTAFRVWCPQCGVPPSVLVWLYARVIAESAEGTSRRNSVKLEGRAEHDGTDE
jgi:hypothetical protein